MMYRNRRFFIPGLPAFPPRRGGTLCGAEVSSGRPVSADREEYTIAKTDFVREVTAKALDDMESTF
jgi:hypothetical protein